MSVSSRKLLILEPVGRLSGGIDPGVGAQRPSGAARHSGRRCSGANRSRCARIDPGAKEPRAPASGPNVRAKTFWFLLGRLPKGTRRKGETASRNTQKNGYSPKTPKAWSAQRPPRPKKNPTTENQCGAKKLVGCGQPKELCQNPSSAQIKCNPEPPAQNSKATNSTPANAVHK